MSEIKKRAFRAMTGLAMGDAVSWPAMFQRSHLLPPWTRRIRREMDAAAENQRISRLPMPFSLNQSAAGFDIAPAILSEWAVFVAQRLIAENGKLTAETVRRDWLKLANADGEILAPVSVRSAISNLQKSVFPPASGHDNPHYFDDAALCRVLPIGIICAGNPELAAVMAENEAAVTHSEDGIWTAKAFAAAASVACAEGDPAAAIDAAIAQLPQKSWSRRMVEQALAIAKSANSIFEIHPELSATIINREYSYGGAAPESLALTLAIVEKCGGDVAAGIAAACTFAKTAESVPALTGALCGALATDDFLSENWRKRLAQLKGISLPNLAGADYLAICTSISEMADRKE